MAYITPLHRASSVRHAIQLSFLAPDSQDLVVAKANRLEIYSPSPQDPAQLVLHHTKTLYGKVTLLEKLRPASRHTDHLFVGTDRYHYFTLSWDAHARDVTTEKSYVDMAEKAARDSQTGDRVHIDPSHRFMSLEVYEGVVNILPIAHAGKGKRRAGATHEIGEIQHPIPVRIPELFVRSTCFLHKRSAAPRLPNPELAILWEDSTNKVRLRVRELDYQPSLNPAEEPGSAELDKSRDVEGPEIELGASHVIALPPPIYGALVVGETSVSYVDEWDYRVADTVRLDEATVFVAWCAIDTQRYLLADDYGKLYLLFVKLDEKDEYAGLQVDALGETSRANTLVYLDAGRVFLGSHQGDSQVLQIREGGFDVLQTFANVAPILDFTIMDMGNRSADAPVNEFSSGQARIVTGSGAYRDGSLRSVRSGVGLEDVGSLGEMGEPVAAVFGLKSSSTADFQDVLVVSSVARTRVLKFESSGEVEEVEAFAGFEMDESTLCAVNTAQGSCLQITAKGVVVGDPQGGMPHASWRPPAGQTITAVSARDDDVLLSLGGATLILLQLRGSELTLRAERHFEAQEQISCLALSSALPDTCVVGFWQDSRISFLSLLDGLSPLSSTSVSDEPDSASPAVPRSLAIAQILPNQPSTLFIGLADGNVVTYTIQSPTDPFTARKALILGTQQPNFSILPRSSPDNDGLQNVLATCENPSLIYGTQGRMVYSAITAESASAICAFDSEAYGAVAVVATQEGEVKLAVVDEERRTHVQTLAVHETVRRIAYSGTLKAFGLGTIKRTLKEGVEEIKSCFRLVDEIAFQELHAFELGEDELVECVMRAPLDDGAGEVAERWVVGTAFLDEREESKGIRGRLLVLEVTAERRLKLVVELGLKGACRCLGLLRGRIVAALVKTVGLNPRCLRWRVCTADSVLTRSSSTPSNTPRPPPSRSSSRKPLIVPRPLLSTSASPVPPSRSPIS